MSQVIGESFVERYQVNIIAVSLTLSGCCQLTAGEQPHDVVHSGCLGIIPELDWPFR